MWNDAPDYWESGGRLPDFRDPWDVIGSALDALAPPDRAPVSVVAERVRRVNVRGSWREWDNAVAPYMREPADVTASRRFTEAVFVGPARALKTQGLVLNPLAHAIVAAPRVVHIVHVSQDAAKALSEEDIGPTIRNSPALAARLRSDNIFTKTFAGGARITFGWPVAKQGRGRTISLVILTDYDGLKDNIDGAGDAFGIFAKRTQTDASAGMTIAESSPEKPIEADEWEPKSPHEAPPAKGIAGLYNGGTRGLWHWPCPDCGELFAPLFERLSYDTALAPGEAGDKAVMVCPHCGGFTTARHRNDLQAKGVWLHEAADGSLTTLDGNPRPGPRASWWLPGPAAALTTYRELVARYEEARRTYEATGDEAPLQRVTNVDLGKSYLPQARKLTEGLTVSALKALATADPWETAPADTAFILVAVDVQRGAFVVHVEAWRPHLARTLIDRFAIVNPPEGAPGAGKRRLDPGRYAEDWRALDFLFEQAWPVAGGSHRLRAVGIICDARGEPGVTPNAFGYWRRARAEHGRRFRLVMGQGGWRQPRAIERAPETAQGGKRKVARDVRIVFAGADRLKDELLASLLREDDGPRAYRIPRAAPEAIFEELCAETRTDDGWRRKKGEHPNEAWDGGVYCAAQAIALGAERLDWTRPPAWAAPGPGNAWAAPAPGAALTHEKPAEPARGTPARAIASDPLLAAMRRKIKQRQTSKRRPT